MVAIAAAMLAGGCRTDNGDAIQLPVDGGIKFGAAVHEISAAQTRTLVANDITHEYGDVDFFIQLDYAEPEAETAESTIRRYEVASIYEGRLDAKSSQLQLKWKDATSAHMFYAWTLPWIKDEAEKYADENEGAESCLNNYYDPDGKPKIVVEFHDSGDGENFEKYQNNAIFEKFIGAQIGPYNYKKQGNYVPLTFYHLVSQVFLNKLTVIRGDGSRHEDLKGDLTFIGMPKKAVFDPHPATLPDGTSPHPAEWITYPDKGWNTHPHHPVVIGPKDRYEPNSELTFFISEPKEDDRLLHRFFICPEVDFSKLAYRVKITTEGADEFGIEYYGDFSKVKFRRVKGNDYDKGTNTGDNSSAEDDTVLHAGEMMTLNITLHPGVGPGATIVIQDWSDPQPTESSHYAHPGIFTDHAAQELADANEKDMEELFNLYGETDEGEKVFKIYENVTVTGNNFPARGDYMIDGMGHTITMGSSQVTVGAMRDVYLTDGTNIVYIDDEGKVFTVDPKTYMMAQTGRLEKGKSSTIDLTTGEVSPA